MFYAENCTSGVFWRKLLQICVNSKQIVMCVVVHNKYVPLMLLTAYRAAGFCANMLRIILKWTLKT